MDEHLPSGPYRATLLWNNLIRKFRTDIPLGRHRRYMKTYDDCFIASDAVEWLHQYLKNNPNFGAEVSKTQTIQLLKKLHRARVFEDVRGIKNNKDDFTDGGRLFRLTIGSPAKAVRTPIALRTNLKLSNVPRMKSLSPRPNKLDFNKNHPSPVSSRVKTTTSTLPECHFVPKPLSQKEIEEQWKFVTLTSLQQILGVETLDFILDESLISGQHIMHNCLYINKSGVVTNIEPKDQLPHWALSAMKCLAYWPDKTDDTLPNYEGFEKDVFRVVRDYFCSLAEPLMTYEMYEVITNVFARMVYKPRHQPSRTNSRSQVSNSTPKLNSFKSIENLLLNLTNSNPVSSECQDASEGYSSCNILDLSPIQSESKENLSNSSQHLTRYETAFGPDNKTVTRVFYGDGISTDVEHNLGSSNDNQQRTPVETHFEETPPEVNSFKRSNSLRHSVHNLFSRKGFKGKLKREKTMKRRRSMGNDLHDENQSSSDSRSSLSRNMPYETPVSRAMPTCKPPSGGSSRSNHQQRPMQPPSYESLYPNISSSHQPVLQGVRKVKRKQSVSSTSLDKKKWGLNNSMSKPSDMSSGSRDSYQQSLAPSVVPGRSLSMSDLLAATPIENELQKQCLAGIVESAPDEVSSGDDSIDRIVQALQLVCLLLPPASRRRLHLLLRLMNKISTNEKLILDPSQPSRNLLLETFYQAVLRCRDESDMDEVLVIQVLAFLMDHYTDVLAVPSQLKSTVEQRVSRLENTKVDTESDQVPPQYCTRVSVEEYENQRLTSSQLALASLLDDIIADSTMSNREKKKRLKQFQKMYPDIYKRRFSNSQSEPQLYPPKSTEKQPLFVKPLLKLKGLRL